jgi:CHAT domain-containing protein
VPILSVPHIWKSTWLLSLLAMCLAPAINAQNEPKGVPPTVSALLDQAIALKRRAQHTQADATIERAHQLAESLTKDNRDRLRAEVAYGGLQLRMLLSKGKLAEAQQQAATVVRRSATKIDDVPLLPRGDYFRVEAHLNQAAVEFRRGNLKTTQAISNSICELDDAAGVADSQRAEAMILAAMATPETDWSRAQAVRLVAELHSMLPADDQWFHAAQVLAFRMHAWNKAAQIGQASKDPAQIDQALDDLQNHIDSFAAELAAAGVHPAVASLGYLALANAEYEWRRLDRVRETLSRLRIDDDSTRIAPAYRCIYHNLSGLLDAEFGRFSAAGDHLAMAKQLSIASGDLSLHAIVTNNIGQLLLRQGDYPNARRHLRAAIQLYERPDLQNQPGRAFAMVNFAKCLEYNDALGEAGDWIKQALEVVESARYPSPAAQRHALSLCLAAQGINAYSFGEPEVARRSFQQLHQLALQVYGERHLHTAESLVNLAWIDLEQQKYASAREGFQAALDIISGHYGLEHPRAAEIMGYLARALLGENETAEAKAKLLTAIELRETAMRRAFQTALSERDRLALVQEMRVHPESMAWPGVFDTFLELAPSVGISNREQYDRVLSWKQVANRKGPTKARDQATQRQLTELQSHQQQVAEAIRALFFSETSFDRQEEKRLRIAQLEEKFRALERQVDAISEDPDHARVAASAKTVADALPPDAMLIDLIEARRYRQRKPDESIADERLLLAYVVGRTGVERVELGARDEVRKGVVAFRNALDRSQPDFTGPQLEAAKHVRQLVPLLRNATKLFVVPDGDLHSMPWAALPGSKPNSFFVEEKSVVLVPHAERLITAKTARRSSEGLLVAGGIDYAGLKDWKPLTGSLGEARSVAQLHDRVSKDPSNLLTGRDASEERLLTMMPRRRIVHLATHGFFSGDALGRGFDIPELVSELESGLVTAPPRDNERGRDQFLTAQEIQQLDLTGVELVVLSACRTGLGTVKSGQGTVGLLAALERAGVEGAITTLWPVRDEETKTFMNAFYQHLWQNRLSPAAALRATQLNCIREQIRTSSGASLAHPKNWAGFVLTGTRH